MPPSSLQPERVLELAFLLCEKHDEIKEPSWSAVVEERLRSASSRAYYSVFLALKGRVLRVHPFAPKGFPRKRVHYEIRRALEVVFSAAHSIPRDFKALLNSRGVCDYEFSLPSGVGIAPEDCELAQDLLERIGDLGDPEVVRIATELAGTPPPKGWKPRT